MAAYEPCTCTAERHPCAACVTYAAATGTRLRQHGPRSWYQRRYWGFAAAGRCPRCGGEREQATVKHCATCRARIHARYVARKAAVRDEMSPR